MNIARNVKLKVIYEGKNISEEIQKSFAGFTYTDNSRDAIDDVSIELENKDNRWLHEWYPEEGSKLVISIIQTEDGSEDNAVRTLSVGTFYVDEPTFTPYKLFLKCIAIPLSQNIRDQKNSKGWEKVTLQELLTKKEVSSSKRLKWEKKQCLPISSKWCRTHKEAKHLYKNWWIRLRVSLFRL